MKLVYTLFILLLSTLAARAESSVSDSVACAPTSIMLANDNVAKQKALGKEYKLTTDWKKHKRFKTAGYCVLGVGACVTLLGIGAYCADAKGDWEEAKVVYGTILCAGGVAIAAGSIPLLVIAHRYKKNAKRVASLTLNCSTASTPMANGAKRGNLLLGACLNF